MEWTILAVVGIPTVLTIGRLIFRTWADFIDAVWLDFMPDIISLLRGRLKEDWIAELKVALFIVLSLIAVAYEKSLIEKFLNQISN